MKKTLLFAFSLLLAATTFAQQTSVSWDFDGTTRKYIQYVPSIYDGSESVPLVVALHGLGDTIENFSGVGFQFVADTANFIVVYPEALIDGLTGSTAWNSGAGTFGIYPNENVDDVGFINALIDTVSAHFNIDQNRVYATGFSMGGFMTNRLACELNNRISAFASVAGTIGSGITCNPGTDLRVCHFHSTADAQVGYGTDGGGVSNNFFGLSVSEWISFWTSNNGCGNISLEGMFPDVASDQRTVDYLEYGGCNSGTRVVHYKAHGGAHDWLFRPTNDLTYTLEIWKFFLGLSPDNLIEGELGIGEEKIAVIGLYPNPTGDVLRLENIETKILNVSIFNTTGQLVKQISAVTNVVDVSDLKQGVYQLMVATEEGLYSNSFIKE